MEGKGKEERTEGGRDRKGDSEWNMVNYRGRNREREIEES
jgi:hypothetical protein